MSTCAHVDIHTCTCNRASGALWRYQSFDSEILKSLFGRERGVSQSLGRMGVFRREPSGGSIDNRGRLVGATAPVRWDGDNEVFR